MVEESAAPCEITGKVRTYCMVGKNFTFMIHKNCYHRILMGSLYHARAESSHIFNFRAYTKLLNESPHLTFPLIVLHVYVHIA